MKSERMKKQLTQATEVATISFFFPQKSAKFNDE
jgi:hypothetical protein